MTGPGGAARRLGWRRGRQTQRRRSPGATRRAILWKTRGPRSRSWLADRRRRPGLPRRGGGRSRDTQSLLCFDRNTGRKLWQDRQYAAASPSKATARASTSSTPACDGKRVFINFLNAGAITTTALDREGKKLWQTKIANYVLHQGFGKYAAFSENLVFVSADNKGTGSFSSLSIAGTGEQVWRRDRLSSPTTPRRSCSTPAGKKRLFFIGCGLVASLDPKTGSPLWEIPGATTECVTSTVTDGNLMFTSGGYPKNHIAAIRADGSGKVVWEAKTKVYVPSMLIHKGHLYGVGDGGVAFCRKADTGAEVWTGRLDGAFTASPILVGDRIYAVNESGRVFVFDAGRPRSSS